MSTQCRIAVKLDNGTYKGVVCHYDGYPSNIIPALQRINTLDKALELVSLNLEYLNPLPGGGVNLRHIPTGDTTFDWDVDSPDHYIFESLDNLTKSKCKVGGA